MELLDNKAYKKSEFRTKNVPSAEVLYPLTRVHKTERLYAVEQ
jgi:hypothetical protein